MSPSLQKPRPFRRQHDAGRRQHESGRRKRGALPGQSSAEDELGLEWRVRAGDRPSATIINREFVQVGNVGRGDYVEIDHDSLSMFGDHNLCIELETDGDVFIGSDITDPSTTYFSIFANNQTYNAEFFNAGDMLIGDNSSDKANIFWDESQGRLKFRGGKTTELYIDTDGALVAGDGSVALDTDGLTLDPGDSGPEKVKWDDGGTYIGELYALTDPGVSSQLSVIGRGRGGSSPVTHESLIEIIAITDDGTAHSGAASVNLSLDTAANKVSISAGLLSCSKGAVFNELGGDNDFRIESDSYTHMFYLDASSNVIGINNPTPDSDAILDIGAAGKPIIIPNMTATQIGNVVPSQGMLAYNSTDGTLDYYTGSAWLQLTGI